VEAKYQVVDHASQEATWLQQILSEFRLQQQHPTTLWCDNQSVIQLAKDLAQHQYIKHIERALQQEVSLVLCPQISLLLNI
jgi:hypothetical protein